MKPDLLVIYYLVQFDENRVISEDFIYQAGTNQIIDNDFVVYVM